MGVPMSLAPMRARCPQQKGPLVTTGCSGNMAAGNVSFVCELRVGAALRAENPLLHLVSRDRLELTESGPG